MSAPDAIQQAIFNWFDHHGRKHLPWQQNITPYRVWLSEVMLQQTTVAAVIPYFERFTAQFATVAELAAGDIETVLQLWSGLGYYSRARNLHKAAQMVMNDFGGEFPKNLEDLQKLPGVGRSTAGAIASISMGLRAPILDGNVKRVLARLHGVEGWPGQSAVANQLWQLAEHYTPHLRLPDWTQAMMDMGATLCTRSKPQCQQCPVHQWCCAYGEGTPTRYPASKPKKVLPEQRVRMLMLINQHGEILLEKRPPVGIWGGLWSFPELSAEGELDEVIAQHALFGLHNRELDNTSLQCLEQWPSFRHTFSHFHLNIEPIKAFTDAPAQAVADRHKRWIPLAEVSTLGLSAPVKKLLTKLKQSL